MPIAVVVKKRLRIGFGSDCICIILRYFTSYYIMQYNFKPISVILNENFATIIATIDELLQLLRQPKND
jgi:hypothetical protein